MDKLKITVNGKSFEAEGNSLMEIIDKFLNDVVEPDDYTDIPGAYNDYMEYLSLEDFNPVKCTTKEQLNDLQKKLNNRLTWIKNHPKADLEYVKHHFDNMKADVNILYDKVSYIMKAYQEILGYIDQVKAN